MNYTTGLIWLIIAMAFGFAGGWFAANAVIAAELKDLLNKTDHYC